MTLPHRPLRILYQVLAVLSPLLLIGAIEYVLQFAHDRSSSDRFDNEREALARRAVLPVKFLLDPKKFADELRGPKTKIAIFGGGSANGYAASFGFADFLEQGLTDHVIHSFAEDGAPFAGTQAELAKVLTPFYDVVIIYAGQNEMRAYLNQKGREQGAAIPLPWGGANDHRPGDRRTALKLSTLEKFFEINFPETNAEPLDRLRNEIRRRAYDFSFNSRLVHLIRSFAVTAQEEPASVLNPASDVQRLPFYTRSSFFDETAKKAMISDFRDSILEIINKLQPDQRLILSTVLANDLVPPLLDVAQEAEIDRAQEKARILYQSLELGRAFDLSEDDVSVLPGGAHQTYLRTALCLKGIDPLEDAVRLSPACLDLALRSRELDTFSHRVPPGVNDFIRSIKGKQPNLSVIDPESVVRTSKSQREYFDYFVDSDHPSATGHMLIANLIIPELPSSPRVGFTKSADCDTFIARREQGQKQLTPDPVLARIQLQNNISWHANYINKVSTPWLYRYYKEKAEEKVRKCFDPS